MMHAATVHPFVRNEVLFGFDLPPEVNAHLQRAASGIANRAEALLALKAAHFSAPDRLEVLMALCKFHFYQGDTEEAHDFAYQTLIRAAQQGGFSADWQEVDQHSTDWEDPRGPGRAFLYSLKALAFIHLRQNNQNFAENILNTLARLDPEDRVGAEVIRDLLHGLEEESNG